MIKEEDGSKKSLGIGGLRIFEMKSNKEIEAQDLEADVAKLVEKLEKEAKKSEQERMRSYYGNSPNVSFLLFAAQLHQAGHSDLAEKLVTAVFATFSSRAIALDQAVTKIADNAHGEVVQQFFESGDFAAYQQALEELAVRFPRGWATLGGIRILLPQVKKQAAGATPPDPSLPGVELNPETLKLVKEWTKPPEIDPPEETNDEERIALIEEQMRYGSYGRYYGGGFSQQMWLLNSEQYGSESAQSKLAALKMEAFPVLIALANDPYLTFQSKSSGYYSSNVGSSTLADQIYGSMSRPATRGELATQMLRMTLPDPDGELYQADQDEIKALAFDFWKEHKDDGPEGLAESFFKNGNDGQVRVAAGILAKSKSPESWKLFEDHVLQSEPVLEHFMSVRDYLKVRKEQAKPFLEKYAKLAREQSDGLDEDDIGGSHSYQIKREGGLEKILKQMASLADGESPKEMAIRIATEDPESARESLKGLIQSMSDEEPKVQRIALLSGAYKAKNEDVRAAFLKGIMTNDRGLPYRSVDDEPAPDRVLSDTETKIWQRFMSDDRPVSSEGRHGYRQRPTGVSEIAASSLEHSVNPMRYYDLARNIALYGEPHQVIPNRAKARLKGESLPPIADAEKVTEERLKEIVSAAGELAQGELYDYVFSLSLDERAAWRDWTLTASDIPYPENVKKAFFEIRANPMSTGSDPIFPILEGEVIDKDFIPRSVGLIARNVDVLSRNQVSILRSSLGPWVSLSSWQFLISTDEEEDSFGGHGSSLEDTFHQVIQKFSEEDEAEAIVELQAGLVDFRFHTFWKVKNGTATLIDDEENEEELSPLEQYQTKLAELTYPPRYHFSYRVLTRADYQKIQDINNE